MSEITIAPYGSWVSPIDAAMLAESGVAYDDLHLSGGRAYWLETRPTESGRGVIVAAEPGGEPVDLSPTWSDVRSRVHEYGGGAFWVDGASVFFSNDADRRVYRLDPGGEPVPVTPDTDGRHRYADGRVVGGSLVVCVRERHEDAGVINELVAFPADGSGSPEIIAGGRDFYAGPRPSPDGRSLAWQSWDLPWMPWDGCELWVAGLDESGRLTGERLVAGRLEEESVVVPKWSPDGRLHFASDRSGWWNLYRAEADLTVVPLCPMEAEFAWPQWVFGGSSFGFLEDGRIVCVFRRDGREHVAVLDPESGELMDLDLPYSAIRYPRISAEGSQVVLAAGSASIPDQIVAVDFTSRAVEVLSTSSPEDLDATFLPPPEAISFPTPDGDVAHALYYTPANPSFQGPDGELPPLVVMSHGGPTAHVTGELDLRKRFFTSRGIGVVDVNYRGSTGYGREFRAKLEGQWGVVDTIDCIAAATFLAGRGSVDADRLAIRGGSAGGYTTLCALTFHDEFAVGASYFGLADLEPFASGGTHKFESGYLDTLVGPYPQEADLYKARSPINFTNLLSAPMIVLQGEEDAVVPPAQSELMIGALRARSIPCAYLLFPGEQHGFRRAEHIIQAHEAELSFYAQILEFELSGSIEPIEIENLRT